MDDYIKREDAIEKFAGVTLIECDETTAESPYSLSAAEKFFADVPSADVVEVVRCRYCKHRDTNECPYDTVNYMLADSDFCSSGERADT